MNRSPGSFTEPADTLDSTGYPFPPFPSPSSAAGRRVRPAADRTSAESGSPPLAASHGGHMERGKKRSLGPLDEAMVETRSDKRRRWTPDIEPPSSSGSGDDEILSGSTAPPSESAPLLFGPSPPPPPPSSAHRQPSPPLPSRHLFEPPVTHPSVPPFPFNSHGDANKKWPHRPPSPPPLSSGSFSCVNPPVLEGQHDTGGPMLSRYRSEDHHASAKHASGAPRPLVQQQADVEMRPSTPAIPLPSPRPSRSTSSSGSSSGASPQFRGMSLNPPPGRLLELGEREAGRGVRHFSHAASMGGVSGAMTQEEILRVRRARKRPRKHTPPPSHLVPHLPHRRVQATSSAAAGPPQPAGRLPCIPELDENEEEGNNDTPPAERNAGGESEERRADGDSHGHGHGHGQGSEECGCHRGGQPGTGRCPMELSPVVQSPTAASAPHPHPPA
ncbi:unnamed protein product [Vitrella brassicaformis CCMP3155]|uniref:Uncharacterized protein n=1 Tax=Vitrella brassicaformis (strain CCMP3155) TaxID=1169540 RepID=A0A0G4EHV1_VITBC|nr:unnamed protein product [Vitrella brassicaformis CCMP3155]|eukprot:CEL95775.1 unnamed protein product [Vitrella brassicaformis CCMP3155]